MRVGFLIWGLCTAKGGLERVGCNLAHAMLARGHEVVIFHLDTQSDSAQPMYPLDPSITLVPLNFNSAHPVRKVRSHILAAGLDIFCGLFSWDALLWFPPILNNTGIPFLISEHSNPDIIEHERWNRYEHLACLASADTVHVLLESFKQKFPAFLRNRMEVIPNPAEPPCAVNWERENNPVKTILAVGRLIDNVKQFSLLIQAFALISGKFSDWRVSICGDGGDKAAYRSLIAEHGMDDRISLHGNIDSIDSFYAGSHIFCIPSRYEGFGLVTTEAQRHALPVVGFARCSGTNEIVLHGKSGILAEDMTPESLAAGLGVLMKNAPLRKSMGLHGQQSLKRYAPTTVYEKWETLLLRTATRKNNTVLACPPLSEEARIKRALEEIVSRKHPFVRPGCESADREILRLRHILQTMTKKG